jgi:hypothetical protein
MGVMRASERETERASYAITAVDCDIASAQSLEAGNWVVATATSSSRTERERDGAAARNTKALQKH